MASTAGRILLAYFLDERSEDGEQVRFAVSDGPTAVGWTALADGAPFLRSHVGECGARDPFLVRLRSGDAVLIATDLRIWPDSVADWERAVRYGSRSLLVWRSSDLVTWSGPSLVEVAPAEAGNVWAPKAFWSSERGAFLVFWASALFGDAPRSGRQYQRIMFAETSDFITFGEPSVYLDLGHDVIDVTFAQENGLFYRFSVNAEPPVEGPQGFITLEVGKSLEDPNFRPLSTGLGSPDLARAEGPAVTPLPDGSGWALLLDEFRLRGYQLFVTGSLASLQWRHVRDPGLPDGARHGSMLPITSEEAERMLHFAR